MQTSREKQGEHCLFSPPKMTPVGRRVQKALVQVPAIAIGGLTHGQRRLVGRKPIGCRLCCFLCFMIQARYGDRMWCLESGDQGMQCFDTLS